MHDWFVSARLASILALVCAMTATARSEGAPFLMLDTGGHQVNFGAWHIRQADGISFRLATTRRPRLGLEGEQGSPDHPAAVRAMQRRQDRPLADRDRLQRAHGGFDRSRADAWGAVYRVRSIIGSEFVCRIARPTTIGGRPGIVPIISGRAWITGVNQYMLDPDDPWPSGYRLADTWPRVREAI